MEGKIDPYRLRALEGYRGARDRSLARHERVHRFSVLERTLHWLMAAAGIVTILTGLGWYSDGLRFLLSWFGGGVWARWIHGVAGIVVIICAVWLIGVLWFRHVFRFIPEDRQWLKVMGGYLRKQSQGETKNEVPPQGFFNGGQKLWGILAVVLAVVFLVSGLIIWSPELFHDFLGKEPFSVPVMRAMYIIHDAAFIIFAAMVVLHVYLSSALNPGTFVGMTRGDVSRPWALYHHPLWYEETVDEARSEDD